MITYDEPGNPTMIITMFHLGGYEFSIGQIAWINLFGDHAAEQLTLRSFCMANLVAGAMAILKNMTSSICN